MDTEKTKYLMIELTRLFNVGSLIKGSKFETFKTMVEKNISTTIFDILMNTEGLYFRIQNNFKEIGLRFNANIDKGSPKGYLINYKDYINKEAEDIVDLLDEKATIEGGKKTKKVFNRLAKTENMDLKRAVGEIMNKEQDLFPKQKDYQKIKIQRDLYNARIDRIVELISSMMTDKDRKDLEEEGIVKIGIDRKMKSLLERDIHEDIYNALEKHQIILDYYTYENQIGFKTHFMVLEHSTYKPLNEEEEKKIEFILTGVMNEQN